MYYIIIAKRIRNTLKYFSQAFETESTEDETRAAFKGGRNGFDVMCAEAGAHPMVV